MEFPLLFAPILCAQTLEGQFRSRGMALLINQFGPPCFVIIKSTPYLCLDREGVMNTPPSHWTSSEMALRLSRIAFLYCPT